MDKDVFAGNPSLIELLTPRQNQEDFEEALVRFGERYRKILDFGGVVSIPDNPMGSLHFAALEVLSYLDLPVHPDRLLVHLNTFHRRADLDETLDAARAVGVRHLLVVSGDGGPRLGKLEPADLGSPAQAVTSVELLAYIHAHHPGAFVTGVAYNPYEPPEHERAKLARKIEAGARFLVTQPVIGDRADVRELATIGGPVSTGGPAAGLPVYVGAWMSRKVELLFECVGRPAEPLPAYDPEANLRELPRAYPGFGLYYSMLSFKKEWAGLLPTADELARRRVA